MAEPFIGETVIFGGNFAPRSWAKCQGQSLPISENQALFAILGVTWGGDGRVTYKLPDYSGRTPIGEGQGRGLSSFSLGDFGGYEMMTLSESQMPVHSHIADFTPTYGGGSSSSVNVDVSAKLRIAKEGTSEGTATNSTDMLTAISPKLGLNSLDMYRSSPSDTVDLDCVPTSVTVTGGGGGGGITSGTVTVGQAGRGQPFSIQQPFLVSNFIIAMDGTFPARN